MNKYDFIKQGNLLYRHTADNDVECRIISTPEKVDSDSIILVATVLLRLKFWHRSYHPLAHREATKRNFCAGRKSVKPRAWSFSAGCPKSWKQTAVWL